MSKAVDRVCKDPVMSHTKEFIVIVDATTLDSKLNTLNLRRLQNEASLRGSLTQLRSSSWTSEVLEACKPKGFGMGKDLQVAIGKFPRNDWKKTRDLLYS